MSDLDLAMTVFRAREKQLEAQVKALQVKSFSLDWTTAPDNALAGAVIPWGRSLYQVVWFDYLPSVAQWWRIYDDFQEHAVGGFVDLPVGIDWRATLEIRTR